MNIIVIRIGDFKKYPPSITLINTLQDLGHSVVAITTKDSEGFELSIPKEVTVKYIDYKYYGLSHFQRAIQRGAIKKKVFKLIDESYNSKDTIIWVEADVSIKFLAYDIEKYNYILRLDELNEALYYTGKFKALKMKGSRLGNSALAVVVPEENRAHITQAWWKLKRKPYVFPNKPYIRVESLRDFELPEKTKNTLQSLSGKKIIVYSGFMHKERPIEPFIQAVEEMDDFAFLILCDSKWNLDREYKNLYYVDFINPPYHLEVIKRSYIGVVAYVPGVSLSSPLNTLFCAPNKIYEYGMFGLPILCNDLPSLNQMNRVFKCGVSADINNIESIKKAILEIDSNYEEYSKNAKRMNDDIDIPSIVSNIIIEASKQIVAE